MNWEEETVDVSERTAVNLFGVLSDILWCYFQAVFTLQVQAVSIKNRTALPTYYIHSTTT